MKRTTYLLSLIMMIACVFTACDKDDDATLDPEKEIIGTWKTAGETIITLDGKKVKYDISELMKSEEMSELIIVFKADGTATFTRSSEGNNSYTTKWNLINNNTQLELISDDEYSDDEEIWGIRFANGNFYISFKEQYENTDTNDYGSGDFSFSAFDKLFGTNITGKTEILETAEIKNLRL